MHDADVPPERAWNTWDTDYPARMVYLPLGLRVGLCVYANRANAFNDFPAGDDGIVQSSRSIDADVVRLTLEHEETRLEVGFDKPQAQILRGEWHATRQGEWGLRFWVMVCLYAERDEVTGSATRWTYDEATGALHGELDGRRITALGERRALLCTFHENDEQLAREMQTHGYWYLESRDAEGPLAVLRYNLEEMPTLRFAIGIDTPLATLERTSSPNARAIAAEPDPLHTGTRFAGALDAVRDVIAWNTVYDPVNRRRYTTSSRTFGIRKFGGYGVWMNDVLFHGVLCGLVDSELAADNFDAVLAGVTEQGNIPCLLTGRDAWIDRSQSPLGAFLVWLSYLRSGDRALLERSFDPLLSNHRWWWRERDGNGNGLLEYGSSPCGRGLYRGTKLAAKDESMMDNSPVHDEARFIAESATLDSEDVGLNSLLALDAEMLAKIGEALGHTGAAMRLRATSTALKARIREQLWDEQRQTFANRLWSGRFVQSIAPTSFYPLLAGAATPEQAAAMCRLLRDPGKFGGEHALPSVSRDDPAYADNVYWRGRIWPPLNFLVYQGLRRYGFDDDASRVANSSYQTFIAPWSAHRQCGENFNAETGAICDQPDTDSFYGWGALMATLGVSELCDVTPWHGFELNNAAGALHLGPLRTPLGETTIDCEDGDYTVSRRGEPLLRTNVRGRFQDIALDANAVRLRIPPIDKGPQRWIEFPAMPSSVPLTLDGHELELNSSSRFVLGECDHQRTLASR